MVGILLWLAPAATPADWVVFLGRLHPVIVHLPIGFLLMAALLELARRWRKLNIGQIAISQVLLWSAVSATMACVFGYMLSLGGGYDEALLNTHMWQGIGVAVFSGLAFVAQSNWGWWQSQKLHPLLARLYVPLLAVGILFIILAGHYGGSLTHGADYLTQYTPGPLRTLAGLPPRTETDSTPPITDLNQAMVYQQIVHPILKSRCIQCHNPEKAKGKLRLDTPDMIRKGGEDGHVLIAGKPTESALIKRCLLPEDHDDHMPPKGKPQLTDSQLALLTWWIEQGAPFDKKVADVPVTEAIRPVLATLVSSQTPTIAAATQAGSAAESPVLSLQVAAPNPQAVAELKKAGLLVTPLAQDKNQLDVNAVNAHTFSDAQAALLPKLADQIVWLRLGDTQISDAALAAVGQLKNLQKLHLEHTQITDAGLKSLKNLPYLEYLNLYGTNITNAGLNELTALKNLKTVYVWQTRVTPQGLLAIRKARPTLEWVGAADTLAATSNPAPAEKAK